MELIIRLSDYKLYDMQLHEICSLPQAISANMREVKFMTMSQPGIKCNIFYNRTGSVLMNANATQDWTHDPTFRHSSPCVFIKGDLMLNIYICCMAIAFIKTEPVWQ